MRSTDLKMSPTTETPSGVDIYFMELQRLARHRWFRTNWSSKHRRNCKNPLPDV
jgi:hypothetical protein